MQNGLAVLHSTIKDIRSRWAGTAPPTVNGKPFQKMDFENVTAALAALSNAEERLGISHHTATPNINAVAEMMATIRRVMLPGFFDIERASDVSRLHHVGVDIEHIARLVRQQVAYSLIFAGRHDCPERCSEADDITKQFVEALPAVRDLLLTDAEAVMLNDPAVSNINEVLLSYPVVTVMLHYRVANRLHRLGVPVLPRIITEMAHSATGIDIHPAATIGHHFAIDHGTGVVIGGTAVVGNHVMLYQGVTLGARNFERDDEGHPVDVPRHPILEDRVVVYSNTSILGRVTIGHDSIIGGNVWLTRDVPPHSVIVQGKPIERPTFTGGAGI